MFIAFAGKAQTINTSKASEPAYIIDSVRLIDGGVYSNYIDPNQIATINVVRDASLYPNGALFISLKDHSILTRLQQDKWLSLSDIASKSIADTGKAKPVLYILNDKLLTDTTGIKIPSICIAGVSLIRASETAYFKTALPDALILMISTKKVDEAPTIFLKGETIGE